MQYYLPSDYYRGRECFCLFCVRLPTICKQLLLSMFAQFRSSCPSSFSSSSYGSLSSRATLKKSRGNAERSAGDRRDRSSTGEFHRLAYREADYFRERCSKEAAVVSSPPAASSRLRRGMSPGWVAEAGEGWSVTTPSNGGSWGCDQSVRSPRGPFSRCSLVPAGERLGLRHGLIPTGITCRGLVTATPSECLIRRDS